MLLSLTAVFPNPGSYTRIPYSVWSHGASTSRGALNCLKSMALIAFSLIGSMCSLPVLLSMTFRVLLLLVSVAMPLQPVQDLRPALGSVLITMLSSFHSEYDMGSGRMGGTL